MLSHLLHISSETYENITLRHHDIANNDSPLMLKEPTLVS